MEAIYEVHPIGVVFSERRAPIDDDWDAVPARIVLDDASFSPDALHGLTAFSHIEVIYLFHKVPMDRIETGARHPRGRSDWPKVGVFAQRVKNRPNRIGLATCRVVSVSGIELTIEGLDAIDGTPVLDIKPVMRGFEPRGEINEPEWAGEIMSEYWSASDD